MSTPPDQHAGGRRPQPVRPPDRRGVRGGLQARRVEPAADRVLREVPQPHPLGHRRPGRGRLAADPAGVPPDRLPGQPRQGRPRRQARRPAVPQRDPPPGLPVPAGPAGHGRAAGPARRRHRRGRRPSRPPTSPTTTPSSPRSSTPDKQPLGLLEVFQEPDLDPRLYQTFLQYAVQMAGYASQYHQFANARQSSGLEKVFTQIEAFARLIHSTLNPTEVAYHVANEGRRLVECDRLCVGVRHGKKVTVEAVSGADVVEKASTHVRRMRALFDAVAQVRRQARLQRHQGRGPAAGPVARPGRLPGREPAEAARRPADPGRAGEGRRRSRPGRCC